MSAALNAAQKDRARARLNVVDVARSIAVRLRSGPWLDGYGEQLEHATARLERAEAAVVFAENELTEGRLT